MGVHGLWELLAPVGRRVSVETLAGKKLAIDASIWMVQFMKAMRDDKGDMVRNAHILGFFRRICKLLFLRTKPVFVFDGGTPALKRRTVIARRRQRENAQAKIRKTAEKLLLNHLKATRLKELANELENQRQKNDAKGKNAIMDQGGLVSNNAGGYDNKTFNHNQEELDKMLAASLAAEEDGGFPGNASTSGAGIPAEEEDDDEDEEMVLPAINGKVDPAVLAALPPSMQLDLLVQMRERLMAENRQKYQKVKKAPAKFSELQIQAYLKTVAFRREIDEVQKSAAGKGVGGVQTSRIASEANREFIFSSSFTGDKQVLTTAGVERNSEKVQQTPSAAPASESLDSIASTKKSSTVMGSVDDSGRVFDDSIATYLDERGRLRVSRVKAMGIRMTRDLQRNLDLMKEIEQDRSNLNGIADGESTLDENAGDVSQRLPDKIQHKETSYLEGGRSVRTDYGNNETTSRNANLIEISFEDDGGHNCLDGDDDLFARLVEGDPAMISAAVNTPSNVRSCDSDSDFDWEEGGTGETVNTHHSQKESRPLLGQGGSNIESEMEWEDGDSDLLKCASPSPMEPHKISGSKGFLEEEADLQEAIRRSLEDSRAQVSVGGPFMDHKFKKVREMAHEITSSGSTHQEVEAESDIPLENVLLTDKLSREVVSGVERSDDSMRPQMLNILNTDNSPKSQMALSMTVNPDGINGLIDKPCDERSNSHAKCLCHDISEGLEDIRHEEPVTLDKGKGIDLIVEKHWDTHNSSSQVSTCVNNCPGVSSHICDVVSVVMPEVSRADAQQNIVQAAADYRVTETTELAESSVKESTICHAAVHKLHKDKSGDDIAELRLEEMEVLTSKGDKELLFEVTEASLEEEMLNLSQERIDLGHEQRKLERNAESVSGEMFAECQELLQMFGLPYIIAPMEAEAQCAYMELANLVDGVVTDDSDVFLFGARSVYKNIFDDRKYVETYFMKDIENELGLTRAKLIRMALLLGSDYTEGVSGIGIVNAIEVLNAFPEEDGLSKFREWIESPDPSILGKFDVQTGSSSTNKGSKVSDNDVSCLNSKTEEPSTPDTVSHSVEDNHHMKQIFMDKHRNVSKNWNVPTSFPNEAVVSAYDSPQVDKSSEPFSWGKPDLFVLRKLCWEKFGWSSHKADELLLPVLKEYSKHETQLRLEAFYTFNERFAKIRSKRIKKAVKGITGNMSLESADDFVPEASKRGKKRRVSSSEFTEDLSEKPLSGTEDCVIRVESNSKQRPTTKCSRKRKHAESEPSKLTNPESLTRPESRRNTSRGTSARAGGRGSGRGRGLGRGRREGNSGSAHAESSSNDGSNSDCEKEIQVEKLEEPHQLRKSNRTRKAVNYTLDDSDMEEQDKEDLDEENCCNKEAVEEEPFEDHSFVGDTVAVSDNQHVIRDCSLEERSSGDYLPMGGGFCADEAEPVIEAGQVSSGHPSLEADLSKEYFKMGGGFCLEENESGKGPDQCESSAVRASGFDNPDPSHHVNSVVEADTDAESVQLVSSPSRSSDGCRIDPSDSRQSFRHSTSIITEDRSVLSLSPSESIGKDDCGTAPEKSLRAMPYLRRKRRKS